ncbi:hypothetical protein GCM10023165_08500 [Variovorax defluvii]|uniref:Membrane protein insertion efficiency factor YidD n=1 Tax=Variovorax defluvii TaxID=913761 RepID=A0ABP8H2C8_9BURK
MQLGTASAVSLIGVYQRWISPRKGYACAHRVHHGDVSCSEFAKQAIAAAGLFSALPSIRHRFIECREAYGAIQYGSSKDGPEGSKDRAPSSPTQGDTCVNICTLPCM